MAWVGWRCTKCNYEMKDNLRLCPKCGYTVYEPIQEEERPDWVKDGEEGGTKA
jgi:predicted  nucleic acid-binding Zn-ribbon protein